MEKLKNFYNKYLKNYIVLLIVTAIVLNLIIETLARHSLIQSVAFMVQRDVYKRQALEKAWRISETMIFP